MYRCNALGIRRICGEQAIRSNESILPGELILKDESFHFCTSSRRFEKIPKEIRQFSFQQIRITLDSSNERRIPFLIFPKFSFPGLACIEYTHFLIVSLLSEKKRRKREKKRKRIEKPFHKPAFQETLLPAKCVESLHNRPFHAIMLVEWT